jgi:BirA family biotin operon repressor/biotin-[acetyl-CoA-carboxylase] ligase
MEDKATSLYLEKECEFDRNQVIGLVMGFFEENYDKFVQTCDLALLKEEYEHFLVNMDEPVRVLDGKNPYQGTARGIDVQGELLVETEDGNISRVNAGEVSVRGLYSYV